MPTSQEPQTIQELVYSLAWHEKEADSTANEAIIKWLNENPEIHKNLTILRSRRSLLSSLIAIVRSSGSEHSPIPPALQTLISYRPIVQLDDGLAGVFTLFHTKEEAQFLPKETALNIIRLAIDQYDWPTVKNRILMAHQLLETCIRAVVRQDLKEYSTKKSRALINSIIQEIEQEITAAQKMGEALEPHLPRELTEISQDYHTNARKRKKKKTAKSGELPKSADKN